MAKRHAHANLYNDLPKKAGHICINVKPEEPGELLICGDPKGLRYLAAVLTWLADFDQAKSSCPLGSREHLHFRPGAQLDVQSCQVEICRADAKGTGELPKFMREDNS